MKITVTPKDYAPAYTPVIYTIDEVDPNKIMEVVIKGILNKVLGIKHFRGERQYAVNVGGYPNKELDVQPIYAQNTRFDMTPSRSTVVNISASTPPPNTQAVSAGAAILIAASQETPEMKQLAKDRKKTTIAEGDIDEISFIAPQRLIAAVVTLTGRGGVKKIAIAEEINVEVPKLIGYRCMSGICSFILNVEDVAKRAHPQKLSDYSRMSVEIKVIPGSTVGKEIYLETIIASTNTIAKREYIITPQDTKTVRLCWLNRQAGIDYYSFRGERAQRVVVDKSRAYTSQGYKTYSSESQIVEMLRSEYEPDQTIEWLSDIISAPKVWRVEGAKFIPIDVVSSSVHTKSSGPTSISITVREVKKKSFK